MKKEKIPLFESNRITWTLMYAYVHVRTFDDREKVKVAVFLLKIYEALDGV